MNHQTNRHNDHNRSNAIGVTPISEWRCTQCGKLLGMAKGSQLHIRVQKNREYLVVT